MLGLFFSNGERFSKAKIECFSYRMKWVEYLSFPHLSFVLWDHDGKSETVPIFAISCIPLGSVWGRCCVFAIRSYKRTMNSVRNTALFIIFSKDICLNGYL